MIWRAISVVIHYVFLFLFWFVVASVVVLLITLFQAHGSELVIASTYNDGTVDANGMLAAHKTLPFGSKLTLTHGRRVVVVTIRDRGPFIKGRTLDLLQPPINSYNAVVYAGCGSIIGPRCRARSRKST